MSWVEPTIVVAAVAAALNAGAFFAFSNFVMPALADLDDERGTEAMQSINRFAPNPLFVATIVGAAAIGVPAVVSEWGAWADAPFRWLFAGVGLSSLTLVITVSRNVPRNDALDALDPTAPSTSCAWSDYVVGWTRWNTARTITSAASLAAYVIAFRGA